eukprot:COSAG06_NODE_18960_length_860_cov_1.219448_1_plen_36_part_10
MKYESSAFTLLEYDTHYKSTNRCDFTLCDTLPSHVI